MIENSTQLGITYECYWRFDHAIKNFNIEEVVKQGTTRKIAEAQLASLLSEKEELASQIREYKHKILTK